MPKWSKDNPILPFVRLTSGRVIPRLDYDYDPDREVLQPDGTWLIPGRHGCLDTIIAPFDHVPMKLHYVGYVNGRASSALLYADQTCIDEARAELALSHGNTRPTNLEVYDRCLRMGLWYVISLPELDEMLLTEDDTTPPIDLRHLEGTFTAVKRGSRYSIRKDD